MEMTNEEFDRRIKRLTERQQVLAESAELMQGSVSDLGAIVSNMVADTKERRERDHQHFIALAKLLESWAGNGDA